MSIRVLSSAVFSGFTRFSKVVMLVFVGLDLSPLAIPCRRLPVSSSALSFPFHLG